MWIPVENISNEAGSVRNVKRFRKESNPSKTNKWRRGWDSNPRLSFPNTRFRGELFQPLRHLSSSSLANKPRFRSALAPQPSRCDLPESLLRENSVHFERNVREFLIPLDLQDARRARRNRIECRAQAVQRLDPCPVHRVNHVSHLQLRINPRKIR